MSELPRETVVMNNQLAQLPKSSENTSKTNAALSTHAATKNALMSLAQTLSHHVTTVKNWPPFNTTSVAAHTNADVSEASVSNLVIVHAQKVTKDLSSMVMIAVQLPDASHVKVQPSSLVPQAHTPHQHHTSSQPLSQLQLILGLLLLMKPRLFHHQNAIQFASTTRVKKFTTVPAGHQLHAHTVNATLTVMFNARRPNALQ